MEIMPEEEFITVSEFAKATRVSVPTVWRWIARGEVEVWRRGKTVRIPRRALKQQAAAVKAGVEA